MIGLDTNVLVRYLMQDDAKQAAKATRLMESLTVEVPGFVSIVSVVELGWVLTSAYGLTRSQLEQALEALLRTRNSSLIAPTRSCRPCGSSRPARLTWRTA